MADVTDQQSAEVEALPTPDIDWRGRRNLVTVYDYSGNYLGCMGVDSWRWLLGQGYENVRSQIETLTRERDECAAALRFCKRYGNKMIRERAKRALSEIEQAASNDGEKEDH
jgi:hypothetical protein